MQGDGDEEEDTKLGRGTHQSHQETLKQRDWAGSGPWSCRQALAFPPSLVFTLWCKS